MSSSGKSSKAKAREFKASGNKAMTAGAFQKAMRQYTRALELDPGNAVLYSNRSATHFNLRQFAESLEDAESAILCDERWWKAYKRKGLALIHMQRYEEAIEALEEGLKIIGKNAEMEKNLEFAKACQEQAQNLYILPEPHMMSRLESVPVFIVTDDVGQPFFVTYEDGQQVCTFYFDKTDAVQTLEWIQNENPEIGSAAQVIHITLNQAFSLAQETQKQYYEETTRAAVEEDMAAARESAEKGKAKKSGHKHELDVDMDEGEDGNVSTSSDDAGEEAQEGGGQGQKAAASAADKGPSTVSDGKEVKNSSEKESDEAADASGQTNTSIQPKDLSANEGAVPDDVVVDEVDADTKASTASDIAGGGEKSSKEEGPADAVTDGAIEAEESDQNADPSSDDGLVDENAPLSFQFRPELRQVKVAVELLNKNPNPPVRPILRDPPSVREAKARAKAEAKAETKAKAEALDRAESKESEKQEITESDGATKSEASSAMHVEDEKKNAQDTAAETAKNAEASEAPSGTVKEGRQMKDKTPSDEEENSKSSEQKTAPDLLDDDDDDELTIENFNGIPIFHAKGLTFSQNGHQLFPLFCSKWDLEAAWNQLVSVQGSGISGKCEVEVGTLEDVLRRMSESKTGEFDNVFFVPSRESMDALGQKFPLDELTSSKRAVKPIVKKASYSRAKQIKARGGSPEEIRAAIEEDLKLYRERQRMAEMVAQLNQSSLAEQGSSSLGRLAGSSSMASAFGRRAIPSEKPLSGHARRSLQREARKKADNETTDVAKTSAQAATPAKARFSDVAARVEKKKATEPKQPAQSAE